MLIDHLLLDCALVVLDKGLSASDLETEV